MSPSRSVVLFDRVGKRLTLTETGRLLYERASQLLSSATALDQEMRAISRGFSAHLRVGFTAVAMDVVTVMVARMSAMSTWSVSRLSRGSLNFLKR
jgi:DNA-binding transcriptional LysR family regulator